MLKRRFYRNPVDIVVPTSIGDDRLQANQALEIDAGRYARRHALAVIDVAERKLMNRWRWVEHRCLP